MNGSIQSNIIVSLAFNSLVSSFKVSLQQMNQNGGVAITYRANLNPTINNAINNVELSLHQKTPRADSFTILLEKSSPIPAANIPCTPFEFSFEVLSSGDYPHISNVDPRQAVDLSIHQGLVLQVQFSTIPYHTGHQATSNEIKNAFYLSGNFSSEVVPFSAQAVDTTNWILTFSANGDLKAGYLYKLQLRDNYLQMSAALDSQKFQMNVITSYFFTPSDCHNRGVFF